VTARGGGAADGVGAGALDAASAEGAVAPRGVCVRLGRVRPLGWARLHREGAVAPARGGGGGAGCGGDGPAEAVAARGAEATGARRMPGGGAGWSGAGHPPDAKGAPAGRQSAGGQRAGPGPAETGVAATRPTRHARVAACPRLWQTLLVQHFRIHESGSLPRQCWELRPRARILAAGSRTPHPKLTTHAFTYVSARATRPSAESV